MDMFVNFLVAAVIAGTPLLFGTLGEILNERVGHINLGVEGMMAIGACSGFMFGYISDSFIIAILASAIFGALGGLLYAVLTVTFLANQNVTGLTLTIFGVGLSNFFGIYMIENSDSGTLKLPETITEQMRNVDFGFLSDIPVVGKLLFSYNPFVYMGIVIAVILAIYLHKTKIGLNIRAIGENPGAADAAGIKVSKLKYINLMIGGAICGIGGAYCSMIINSGVWMSDSVNGLGWISVALVIFATWKPINAIWGSLIFGGLRVLKYYVPKSVLDVPVAFYDMLPFLITAIVLIVSSIRMKKENNLPASCGVNYFREER